MADLLSPLGPASLPAALLLDALAVGVLVLGRHAEVLYLNQQAADWWGLPAAVAPGCPLAQVGPGLLPAAAYAALQQAADQQLVQGEYWLPAAGQWVALASAGLPTGDVLVQWQAVPTRLPPAPATQLPGLSEAAAAPQALATHQPYLLRLADALRPLADLRAIQQTAVELLGQYLAVNWVLYLEVQPDLDTLHLGPAYAQQVAALPATLRLADFGDLMSARYQAGETVVTDDVLADANYGPALHAAFAAVQVRAAIGVPLRKDGQLLAIVSVQQASPRHWSPSEIALVEETAERTWAAVARARAGQALRASEEQFRAVANLVPDLLWRSAPDSETTWYNQRWYEYTGQTPEKAAGYGWASVMHPDDQAESSRRYRAAVATGEPLHQEHRIRSATGEYRWFQVEARPLLGGQGEVTAWFGAATDIHARKQREQHQEFLLHLSDTLRVETGVAAVGNRAVQLLAGQLQADRVYLATLSAADDTVVVTHEAQRADLPPLQGAYRRSDLPAAIKEIFERTIVYDDVRTDARLTELDRLSLTGLGAAGFMAAPIRRGSEAMIWAAGVVSTQPRAWTAAEVSLLEEAIERIWAAVEQARTEEVLAASEMKYRTLFGSIDEGFCLIELLLDARGTAVDYRFLEVNPVFEQQTGLANAPGRLGSEQAPGTRRHWLDAYEQVMLTGEPVRFENYHASTGRWYEAYATRVGGAGSRQVCTLFADVTGRRRHEAHLALLAEASQELTRLADVDETMSRLGARLAAHMGLSACVFAELVEGAQVAIVRHGWHRADMPDLRGAYRMAEFATPEVVRRCQAGEAVVIRDVWTDPLVDGPQYAALNIGSFVIIPLVRDGEWRFLLVVYRSEPYDWPTDEIEPMRELMARIWAWLERARTEKALRASETRLHSFVQASSDALYRMSADWQYMQRLEGQEFLVSTEAPRLAWLAHYIPPDEQPVVLAAVRAAVAGKRFFELEHRVYGADGSVNWTFSRAVPVLDEAGEVTEWFGTATNITARKQAEEALQVSELRLRSLVANLPGTAVFIVDRALRYQVAEGEALHQAGLTPADFVGRTVPEVLPPALAAEHAAYYQAALAGEAFELEHETNGRAFATRGVPLPGAGGHIEAVLAVSFDITERRRAEEVLRASEQQLAGFNQELEQRVTQRTRELRDSRDLLQSILDTSLIAMSVMEAVRDEAGAILDFRLVVISKELEHQTGRHDLVGKLYTQEYPGVVDTGLYDLILRAVATGEPQGLEYHYTHEGFDQWFACQFVKLGDGVVATNLDITERKTAEQERGRNLQLLTQAEAVAGLGSWDYDPATGVLRWSAGMYQLFGVPPGEPVRPAIYLDLAPPDEQEPARELVALLTGPPTDFERTLCLRAAGGTLKTIRVKGVTLAAAPGQPRRLLGVDLDISQVRRLEADNLRLHLSQQQALFEAVQGAQEEERRRMAETLHNGIGQLLYAVKLQLDLLPPLPEEPARREAARLLSDAIRQTRALSHELTPALLEEFGLDAALQRICRTLNTPTLRWHCYLVLDEGPPLPPALQLAVYRLAQELAQNVVKHAQAHAATLEVEVLPAWVVLRVEDNGLGFDPDSTSDGLGLRTLRSRVALLGGSVHLHTEPGQGTRYQIRLPLPSTSTPV